MLRAYIDSFNARDIEGVLATMHPEAVISPTKLARRRRHYHRHAGVREWMQDVVATQLPYQARLEQTRQLSEDRWLMTGTVHVDGEPTNEFAAVARIRDGLLCEVCSYLSEADVLAQLGLLA